MRSPGARSGCLAGLTGLHNLVGSQAARTHAEALDSAVDQGANALEVGLEPTRRDIVRVADITADDRPFSAKFAAFRHEDLNSL